MVQTFRDRVRSISKRLADAVGYSYDAVESKNRRQAPSGLLRDEENELPAGKRRLMVSGARDLARNFSLAAWAIRKHLDFVASHAFQCRTGDRGLDNAVSSLMREWSEASQCDVAARHPLSRAIRLAEARRLVDGDIFCLKLADGRLQWVEGDRIRDPSAPNVLAQQLTIRQGVVCDSAGRATQFAVHRRTSVGFEFERLVSADNLLQHAWFDRFDQVRGISPLASALNSFRDVYESFDYALAKAKIAQLFGLVLFRNAVDAPGAVYESDDSTTEKAKYDIDFGRGPVLLDLDPGDDAKFLENKTPSSEFREYMQMIISVCLKSLDIPFSFFDEAYTNFFGSRSALILYLKSAREKRKDIQHLLNALTSWRISLWIADGTLALPPSVDFRTLLRYTQWIPDGVPWWDPSKEIRADIMAVSAGLRTRREIRRESHGDDWFDVVDDLAEEEAYIKQAGITVTEAGPEIYAPDPVVNNDANN